MKTIVEFGYPQSSVPNRPCGVSGSIIQPTIKDGIRTAAQLVFVLNKGAREIEFSVSRSIPRQTYWAADRSFWVSLSILDGVMRGPYSAKADKEAQQ